MNLGVGGILKKAEGHDSMESIKLAVKNHGCVIVSIESLERAQKMLLVAAEYIEDHWPDGTVHYDEESCDGYCVAEDCKIAASMLEEGKL